MLSWKEAIKILAVPSIKAQMDGYVVYLDIW